MEIPAAHDRVVVDAAQHLRTPQSECSRIEAASPSSIFRLASIQKRFVMPLPSVIRSLAIAALTAATACSCVQAAATRKNSPELQQARQRLALAEATAARIARERAILRSQGPVSPEIAADLDAYQNSVAALAQRHRQTVAYLEQGKQAPSPKTTSAGQKLPDSFAEPKNRHDKLEDEFAESLAAFDEFLLVEIDAADNPATAGSDQQMTDLARQAAAAAERLRERGIDVAGETQGASAEGDQGEANGEKGGENNPGDQGEIADAGDANDQSADQAQQPASEQGESSPVAGQGDSKAPTSGGAPPGTPPPGDDDIVARQLREAAEREKDPVLREKLWREYRAYKEGTRNQ